MNAENDRPAAMDAIFEQLDQSDIASIKGVVSGVLQIISDPTSTAKNLKEIVEIDPPLTARVLFLANSAHYAPRIKILDIMQAIIFVGFDAIKELALSQKVANIFQNGATVGGYSSEALWKHCLATALFTKMIYRREFRERGDNAYACGLLHDIGIIALQQFMPEVFYRILKTAEAENIALTAAEKAALGFDHADLGRAITEYWNFPEDIVQAIGAHHAPGQDPSRLAQTLFIADTVTRGNELGYESRPAVEKALFQTCLNELNINHQAVALVLADVQKEIANMETQGMLSYGNR
ncbi:MAG: HDOD domain-containing protein [Desulfobacterales bacterium]|nr:HDOD domain-containing protein [Desulfobacterales bacterium]